MGSDDRIGRRFLCPGIGYGGSCFPKDVKALIKSSKNVGYEFKILESVEQVNAKQKLHLINALNTFFEHNLGGKKFAFWGLSFKPNTDDVREAPALEMISYLLKEGAEIIAFDPEAMKNVRQLLGEQIHFAENMYQALEGADGLIIATEWSEFRTPDFERIGNILKRKVIFDGRNLFELAQMQELGFTYFSIGRATV
jgi:UDPglucose 6-dehydrogenase